MVKAILDTDILSEYLKGHDSTVTAHAARYATEHGIFTFTSVTVYEIVYGLELKAASAQLLRARAWLDQNEEITPSNADYLLAATRRPYRCRRGSAWVACCDREHGTFSGYSTNRCASGPGELAAGIAFHVQLTSHDKLEFS
jgi:predicted nucleic acid-binding protein